MAEVSESWTASTRKPSEEPLSQYQVSGTGDANMLGMIYPGLLGFQNQEHRNGGAGIYAVPLIPVMDSYTGLSSDTLIPLTSNIPTTDLVTIWSKYYHGHTLLMPNIYVFFYAHHLVILILFPANSRPASADAGAAGEEHGQVGQQQQAPQGQVVVRRFQIAFQIDLLLILKLVAVIFLFNQDGSRQQLFVLVFFASLVYLYQTGALAPLLRWLSQGMHRAAAPPQPPRPAVRAENMAPAAHVANENAAMAEGQPGVENENHRGDENNPLIQNEEGGVGPVEGNGGNQWWGIVKEIQMIVFGFVTSLLPGYRNID
ncbi:hypothetical protein RJ641_021904 [Dillenia turbinata]|uniref:Transmembrane protein n=1 Tax=Dillenia turbinata TaxID=194707 RepID=A0AAN8YYX1_9MAGN